MLRPHLASMLARQMPQLPVLAYDEIAPDTRVEAVGTISLQGSEHWRDASATQRGREKVGREVRERQAVWFVRPHVIE